MEKGWMKPRTEKSMELYEIMLRKGYPEPFSDQITKRKDVYKTEEGCLSLDGVRPCTRYREIEVD